MSATDGSPAVKATDDAAATSTTTHGKFLYALAAVVSLIGLADAIYLTVHHLTGQNVQCTIVNGCDEVLASSYATIGGFPLAAIGAAAYLTVFSLATLICFGYRVARRLLTLIVAAMMLVTLWLLFLQAFVIKHFCEFCLISAAVTTSLTLIVLAARWQQRRNVLGAQASRLH